MSPAVNVDLEEVPFAILELVKARILANRRRLLQGQQGKPRPSTRPGAQFRKVGASSKEWRKPQYGAGVFGVPGFLLPPDAGPTPGQWPVKAYGIPGFTFSNWENSQLSIGNGPTEGTRSLIAELEGSSSVAYGNWDKTMSNLQKGFTVECMMNIGEVGPVGSNWIQIRLVPQGWTEIPEDEPYTKMWINYSYFTFDGGSGFDLSISVVRDYERIYDRLDDRYSTGGWLINPIVAAPSQWAHVAFTSTLPVDNMITETLYFKGQKVWELTSLKYVAEDWLAKPALWELDLYSSGSVTAPAIHGLRYTDSVLYKGDSFTPPTSITRLA